MAEYIVNTSHSLGYQGDDFAAGVKRERIVRCKDCKHYRSGNRCWKFSHDNGATVVWGSVTPDGFCAWGEVS